MKLAYNINSFDASEHLEPIISEIRNEVDIVNCIWQKKSYCGNPIDKEDYEELQRLKSIGLVDNLIEFVPDYSQEHRLQETNKRNMGVQLMKEQGCTHVISADADEYYDKDQFRYAKEFIQKKGYNITYCSYVNYYKDFSHYLVYPFRPFVPFIHSTYFTYVFNGPAPGPTDPTRRLYDPFNLSTYLFEDNEIRMGHAAWIRKNIRKKLENWSAKDHFKDKPELIDKAVDQFNNWKEGDNAIMLFNVTDNSVYVKKLETKIHKI